MTTEPAESQPAERASVFEEALETAIDCLEHDAEFDFERFLAAHPLHADALRAHVEKLRRTGMLRPAGAETNEPELPEATLLPSRPIAGRYRALREIGRGGMGRVLLARDDRLGREVAIKLAHRSGNDPSRARLEREARILAQLEHPGIVAVHDGGTTEDGRAFCAMRVLGGRTLHDVIAESASDSRAESELGLARKVQIATAICDAIDFAHRRGIVHRDLKPANVMVGESGEVQVVDWGLAKRVGTPDPDAPTDRESFASFSAGVFETVDGYAFGTPSYSAPEQARGEVAEIDARSDVFGLGAILHHMLVGRPPYYGKDRDEVLERAREGRLNDPDLERARPRVPPELVAACRKACAPKKLERYGSARDLADDLRAFLETRTVKAYRTGALAELSSWMRRNRSAVALAVAVFVVGAFALIAGLERAAHRELELTADEGLLPRLVESADEIGPWYPGQLPSLEAWQSKAEALAGRLATHRERRDDARRELQRSASAASILSAMEAQSRTELVESIEEFVEPEHGLVTAMHKRAQAAQSIETRSMTGEDARRAWDAAIRSVSDPADCPKYAGVTLRPQMGLLPIGRDPRSGLWEFAALLTGEVPVRDASGRLKLRDETAVVLVLVPGGAFDMGAQSKDAKARHFDALAQESEDPVVQVSLAPFFISKYEMTQAQWTRITRNNPSFYSAGQMHDGKSLTLVHPVESVSWDECMRYLRLVGLSLPTEAQWEYAARAGTSTIYWTGDDPQSIEGAANIADQACKRIYPSPDGQFADLDDGWALHAPVDFGRANAFGLHGTIGNMCEWCRDDFESYEEPPAPVDGDRTQARGKSEVGVKVLRDCSYYHSGGYVRITHRMKSLSNARDLTLGVRPARAVEP